MLILVKERNKSRKSEETHMTVKKKKEKNSLIDVKEIDSNYNIESKQ